MKEEDYLDCYGEPSQITFYNVEIESVYFPWGGEVIRGTYDKVRQYLIDEYGYEERYAQEIIDHTMENGRWNNGCTQVAIVCRQTNEEIVECAWSLYSDGEKLEEQITEVEV